METNTKRWSIYNTLINEDNTYLLYNCFSDVVIALSDDLKARIEKVNDNPEQLKNIHPSFYEFLINNHFIVDFGNNEIETIINEWSKKEKNDDEFTLTINPTLDCNLRCWYCYENHCHSMNMSPEIVSSIKQAIYNLTMKQSLKKLNIDFFGGEPLMKFNDVVMPILKYAHKICKERQKILSVRFTTNGVLLTDNVLNQLQEFNHIIPVSLQITLDGNKEAHDQVRHNIFGEQTFNKIIRNIKNAIKSHMHVSVRFNYTTQNINTFTDIIKEFESMSDAEKKQINFDFQQVWQDQSDENILKNVSDITEHFYCAGLNVLEDKTINPTHCYADFENHVVINYNGDLYKCTAREFIPELRDGFLTNSGTFIWNERYKRRMSIKHGTTLCHACQIFPFCHGGCSQAKLESTNGCLYNYSEKDKEIIIRKRILWLIKHPNIIH